MSLLINAYPIFSSIDRRYRSEWESQQEKYGYDTEEDEFYVIGDRVYVDGFRPASVAYFGEVEFGTGDWVGVVLDEPTGNHDGRLHGRQYFQCTPLHGLFVRPLRVTRMLDSALGSSAASSRLSTPLPSSGRNTRSPANSSVLGSYFYDEDYRQDRLPTVASLSKKLRSINDKARTKYFSSPSSQPAEGRFQSPTPTRYTGILKRGGQRSQSTEPLASRSFSSSRTTDDFPSTDQYNSRTRFSPSSSRASPSSPVFNFRPRRAKLDEYEPLNSRYLSQSKPTSTVDLSNNPPQVGDHVTFRSERGELRGTLRYLGETQFATGEWAGIELNEASGKNDGAILGERYFHCPQNYGLFVPAIRVRKYDDTVETKPATDFDSMRYTIKSPPPATINTGGYRSRSATPIYIDKISHVTNDSPSLLEQSPRMELNSPGNVSSPKRGNQTKMFADTPLPPRYSKNSTATSLSYIDDKLYQNYDPYLEGEKKRGPICNYFKERNAYDEASKTAPFHRPIKPISYNIQPSYPKSVKYTFSSSKYDGNPIVRRTVEYN